MTSIHLGGGGGVPTPGLEVARPAEAAYSEAAATNPNDDLICECCGERPALDGVKPLLNADPCSACATELALEGLSLRLLLRSIKPADEDTHCYSGSYWCNDGPDGFCECDCKGCRS